MGVPVGLDPLDLESTDPFCGVLCLSIQQGKAPSKSLTLMKVAVTRQQLYMIYCIPLYAIIFCCILLYSIVYN